MSFAIVCHGCGASLPVPDDYQRNKMQCPECGVFCEVPPRPAAAKKKEPERRAVGEKGSFDDEPAAPIRAAPPQAIVKEPVPAGKDLTTCPHCGEMVRIPKRKRGQEAACPVCGGAWAAPVKQVKPQPPPVPVPPLPDEFAGSTPDEDPETSNPYRTADAPGRRCPGCTAFQGPEVVVCVRCGFDLRTGRKVGKEYQKIDRAWQSGPSLRKRQIWFAVCQALVLVGFVSALLTVNDSLAIALPTLVIAYLIFTGMTAFLLGTFDSFELKRLKSGRVDLARTWRFCFVRRPTHKIDTRDYGTVVNGAVNHGGILEWLIFFMLFGFGIIPGVIYWYCTINKTEYTVALARDHEVPEVYVYRGWSQEEMLEIKQLLANAMTA